jgi:hypothetical protein
MEHSVERPLPTPVTDKEAMAKANAEETERAHKLAAERRAQDENQPPLVNTIADLIKDKLTKLPPLPEGQSATE